MNIHRRIGLSIVIWTVGISVMTCNRPGVRDSESVSPTVEDPGIIVLVPFFVSRPEAPGRLLVRCPRCEGYMTVGEVAPEGPAIITGLFRRDLGRDGYNLVAPGMVERALTKVGHLEGRPEVLAQRLASALNADNVLMGWIFQYRERIGSDWGARQPASVTFVALLFDGKDGRLLWRAKFDETQRPLSEDILRFPSFIRRGGRWVSAKELASDGVNLVLLRFPGKGEVKVNR